MVKGPEQLWCRSTRKSPQEVCALLRVTDLPVFVSAVTVYHLC